jgi:hypothetical protein
MFVKRRTWTKFEPPPFGFPVGLARRPGPASLAASFLSSSPAPVRSADGSRQGGKRRVLRPAAQRGHGPACPDGTRPRATIADKVMKSGRDGWTGNGRCVGADPTQVKRAMGGIAELFAVIK